MKGSKGSRGTKLRSIAFAAVAAVCFVFLSQWCAMNSAKQNRKIEHSRQDESVFTHVDKSSRKDQPITSMNSQPVTVGYAGRYHNYYETLDTYRHKDHMKYNKLFMVVQFDSRPPIETDPASYIWGSFYLWSEYALLHGHQYVFYTSPTCQSCDGHPLSSSWCKVAAVLQAWRDFPDVQLFVYTDSDATISDIHFNTSLLDMVEDIAFVSDDPVTVLLNQDGPGHWCQMNNMFVKNASMFEHCLNSGTFILRRSAKSRRFLQTWFELATQPQGRYNPFQYDVTSKWPWEQGPLHVAKEMYREDVMVVPHPHRKFMNWYKRILGRQLPIMPYCLSHMPGAKCYISHYCTDQNEKQSLAARAVAFKSLQSNATASFRPTPLITPPQSWYCDPKNRYVLPG